MAGRRQTLATCRNYRKAVLRRSARLIVAEVRLRDDWIVRFVPEPSIRTKRSGNFLKRLVWAIGGKSWEEQYEFGLRILRKFGVLK